jgi:cell division protein FtsI (penicillin-binding protein 3)
MSVLVARPTPMRRADSRRRFAIEADRRLGLLLIAFLVVGAILLARICQLVVVGLFSDAHAAPVSMFDRADIVDRNGVPLARTIPVSTVRVVKTRLMNDPAVLAPQLARIFPDRSAAWFLERMTMRVDAIIGHRVSEAQAASARDLLAIYRRDHDVDAFADGLAQLVPTRSVQEWHQRIQSHSSAVIRSRATPAQLNAVNDLAEIGFEYPEEAERLYPQGSMAAHVLGFIAPGRGGAMGIERQYDDRLNKDAAIGRPLELSLDTRVQAALELELGDAVTRLEAKGGAGLVLDVDTGEVVAMASLPTFDPNRVRFENSDAQWNSVSYTTYELGSTFKPITVAAAIDAGTVTSMGRRYDATRPLIVGAHRVRDSHSSGRWLNVPEMLMYSSNVVTAQVADELGPRRLEATFRALDFDKRPAIELPERGLPRMPSEWSRITTMTASFGYSVQVTPLHLASAYAALVNGGIYRPATILKIKEGEAPAGRRVFTEATSARMRQLLRMIVASGTGTRADAPGYRIGGKTGSAERVVDGRYARNSVVATFAAAFPMDRPRYVVLVMIDRPPGNAYSLGQRTAGFTAAPVVRKVVQRIGPMVGIYPDEHRDVDISELEPLLWKPRGER